MEKEDPMSSYISLYGSVKLIKAPCRYCNRLSFIIEGRSACCHAPQFEQPLRYHRESLGHGHRKAPPLWFRRHQLAIQDYQCFYCDRAFQCVVFLGKRRIRLRIEWDHMVPFVYLQTNPAYNFVASCQICKRMKGDLCVVTIEEAVAYVKYTWAKKGYRDTSEDVP